MGEWGVEVGIGVGVDSDAASPAHFIAQAAAPAHLSVSCRARLSKTAD